MQKEFIEKIITACNVAPSGGNSQPWSFVVQDDHVDVHFLHQKDHKVLNFRTRGTFIAHGALLENMEISARSLGFEPKIEIFPQKHISLRLTLGDRVNGGSGIDFYNEIFARRTNRKRYDSHPLSQEEKEYIFQDTEKYPNCDLRIVEGNSMKKVAEGLVMDTIVFLQNKLLHKLLFHEIIWKEKDQRNRHGLYIKTLEMVPPKSFVFRMLRRWSLAKLATKIGLPNKIREENIKTVMSSSVVGAILVNDRDLDFMEAGRFLQRIWLRATRMKVELQVVTAIPFLWQQLNFGTSHIFSEKEKILINDAHRNLKESFNIGEKTIAVTFRLGKAQDPLAVSYKRPPIIEWL